MGAALAARAVPWLAAALACASLLEGIPRGHDARFELVRVIEYSEALAEGQLPPYVGGNLYGGYGSPIFLFYAPLFSALGASSTALLGGLRSGIVAALVLLTALGTWLSVKLLEALTRAAGAEDRTAAAVGAAFFVLHPYVLCDKLVRNANAEFTALCLAPLALWGLLECGPRPRRGFVLLAAGLALVICAHNLTALVVAALVVVGAPLLYAPRASRSTWLAVGGGVAFGLALSAWFWLPALWLTDSVRMDELVVGKYHFQNQFPTLRHIFGSERFFGTGPLTPAVYALGIVLLWRRGDRPAKRLLAVSLLGGVLFAFLVTPASAPLWETLPLLPLFQFPWRMLGPVALLGALVATLVFAHATATRAPRARAALAFACLAACGLNALPLLRQVRHFDESEKRLLRRLIDFTTPPLEAYAATARNEYLPPDAIPELWKRDPARVRGPVALRTPSRIEIDVLRDTPTRIELDVRAAEPSGLRIRRWSFPPWEARLAGEPLAVAADRYGSVSVDVPAGEARLVLDQPPPPIRRAALAASGVALLLWIATAVTVARRGGGAAEGAAADRGARAPRRDARPAPDRPPRDGAG